MKSKELAAGLQQLLNAQQLLGKRVESLELKLQETRNALEKLARVSELEYSQDVMDWVDKDKLDALRKEPRT